MKIDDNAQLLDAIESDPADDVSWLILSDWLEERGDQLAGDIRDLILAGRSNFHTSRWKTALEGLCLTLPLRKALEITCDYFERVLPLYEAEYPHDHAPRHFLKILRQLEPGRRLAAARRSVKASLAVVNEENPYSMNNAFAW